MKQQIDTLGRSVERPEIGEAVYEAFRDAFSRYHNAVLSPLNIVVESLRKYKLPDDSRVPVSIAWRESERSRAEANSMLDGIREEVGDVAYRGMVKLALEEAAGDAYQPFSNVFSFGEMTRAQAHDLSGTARPRGVYWLGFKAVMTKVGEMKTVREKLDEMDPEFRAYLARMIFDRQGTMSADDRKELDEFGRSIPHCVITDEEIKAEYAAAQEPTLTRIAAPADEKPTTRIEN